jgi:hypothetical protein
MRPGVKVGQGCTALMDAKMRKVGLHFACYNFVRRHNALRCTPAMETGVERSSWGVADPVEAVV